MKENIEGPTTFVFLYISFLLLFPFHLSGQTTDYSHFSKQVDGLFKDRITQSAPGAAVVVTEKGKTIFQHCYGLADIEHNIPITSKTMFNLASVAKQFTAFGILLLEKEGKIGLEDDIHKYLPNLPNYSKPVTIRNLLNHTSGIWEYYSTLVYYCGYDKDDHFTLDEKMELLKQQKKLLFEPGSQWSYCNTNYLLLSLIVEKVTGITFQEWTKNNIFEPLGMENSFFIKNSSQLIMDKAESYKKGKDRFLNEPGPWVNAVGMGYLFTNLEDMVLWMDNFRTKKVGGENVIDKMFQKTKLNNGSESFYGYGVGVLERSGKLIIGHSGQTSGYKTADLYCPELELGITLLANERSINSESLVNNIFDIYIGKDVTADVVSKNEEEFLPLDAKAAEQYTGGYIVENLNAKLAVNIDEHSLHCAFYGLGEDFFYPITEKRYANRPRVNFIEFHEDENGIPNKVTVTIRQDTMTANKIIMDVKGLEARLPDYLGSYYGKTFNIVYTFYVSNGRLVMHHRRYGDMRIEPIDRDEFFFDQGFVKFERNQDNKVIGFKLTPSDEKFYFQSFEFIKLNSGE